ncbi:MAG: Valine-tRNA ligase [Parcubacteria group bacterium GW2011_GWA2_43_17]|nr:MAG: Valine-tRNA ligase [Parcubacteria group bacterium GW2011_GWA2_43_17]HBR13565.1 valine--tRNA ligase [Candidatus Komeilibacteria bacterium]
MPTLDKTYEPHKHEDAIYQRWEESGYFNPDNLPGQRQKAFTIVLPPPNVTGKLHLGHASMLSYQDIMIRYHRLKGDKTLWLPGMDHAAIATQNVVEKELKQQGKTRHDLGRAAFLAKVNDFAEASKKIIRQQIKKMGSSLDWSRERFTLDENLSLAVRTAFKRMYDDGLIYRGDRVVNWCPRCQSTLADDEVEYEESQGQFYFIKYGPLTIATTRPETKLGDTGVAVNPKDERYKKLIGQVLPIDLAGHKLAVKVFGDSEVDQNFGSGAIGVTPAHSQQDFKWAEKYNLPLIKVIDERGEMTAAAGKYQGLSTLECRNRLVADLRKAGLLEKIEDYKNNLSVCYRCKTSIEPLTSRQWFVDVNKKVPSRGKSLKQLATEAVSSHEITIIPDRFNKIYFQWMDNLRDWCISRQIWYGHQIPVWYRQPDKKSKIRKNSKLFPQVNKQEIFVGLEPPTGEGWIQDQDTLDTWFSAGLWTFSTLGWPKQTKDLKIYHPTSVLETMYDILFFWVARMIIMSLYFLKEKPFATVYLHAMIKDKQGRKMSKSLGNGIDPLEMIKKFGADALRLSMVIGSTPGTDLRLYEEKIAGYRNFVNKLWNISRYIISKLQETNVKIQTKSKIKNQNPKTLADEWILAELNKIIQTTTKNIEEFKFSQAGEELYEFTWSKLADWYLEVAKLEGAKEEILLYILERLLILWHPFCPFVTEVLWQNLSPEPLIIQSWPSLAGKIKKPALIEFAYIQALVSAIRNARAEHRVNPKKIFTCAIETDRHQLVAGNQKIIEGLAKVRLTPKSPGLKLSVGSANITLDIKINQEVFKTRAKELKNLERYINIQEAKLANKEFTGKAPATVIMGEQAKLAQAQDRFKKLSSPG